MRKIADDAPWNIGWTLSDEERQRFRETSKRSRDAKLAAMRGDGQSTAHEINEPRLDPENLMPQLNVSGLSSLSLFSGCGGLDIGFERAGFAHVASYDFLDPAGRSLRLNRPEWEVYCGESGDVRGVEWRKYRGIVDVLHGGPPCQPFSIAGRQLGHRDTRDMFPEFVRAVREISPRVFIAENVPALGHSKFSAYINRTILRPLSQKYTLFRFELRAADFGVPQTRRRLFFVGFRNKRNGKRFEVPRPTHSYDHLGKNYARSASQTVLFEDNVAELLPCMGAREALGLPNIGFDALAPTLRSSLTGPRHTTSVLSSVSALRVWNALQIWPNGVAPSRLDAQRFAAPNRHFRMSVQDCAVLQGFPRSWHVFGSVYVALGQIGNAVAPPMAYQLAAAVRDALME